MKFSIIICTYNAEKKLPKTLDSIFLQTDNDYEVIIIDGASSDSTIEIIKKYEKKFVGKLRWISEKDSGIYNAMNKGVKMAKGEYVNVIGTGDWLEEGALKEVAKAADENPGADAIYGKTRIWDRDMQESKIVQTLPEILFSQPMQHPAIFYKRKLHNKFGLYDESYRIVADYLFCLKAFCFGKATVKAIDVITSNFVMNGISSKKQYLCFTENIRARKDLSIKVNIYFEFLNYLKSKVKR